MISCNCKKPVSLLQDVECFFFFGPVLELWSQVLIHHCNLQEMKSTYTGQTEPVVLAQLNRWADQPLPTDMKGITNCALLLI